MHTEIYADILFLINLIMIYFILRIMVRLLRRNISKKRVLAVSFAVSFLYCLILLLPPAGYGINIFTASSLIIISVFFCFRPKKLRELIKLIFILFITSASVGGAASALFYYSSCGAFIGNLIDMQIRHFPIKLFVFSLCICFLALRAAAALINNIALKRQSIYPVKLFFENGKPIFLSALVDTGNSLKEPVSGKSVIIAEFDSLKAVLPDPVKLLFYEGKSESISELSDVLDKYDEKERLYLIPFSSLGKKHGLIPAIRAEKAEISADTLLIVDKPYIAIFSRSLSPDNSFNSIISPEITDRKEVSI